MPFCVALQNGIRDGMTTSSTTLKEGMITSSTTLKEGLQSALSTEGAGRYLLKEAATEIGTALRETPLVKVSFFG